MAVDPSLRRGRILDLLVDSVLDDLQKLFLEDRAFGYCVAGRFPGGRVAFLGSPVESSLASFILLTSIFGRKYDHFAMDGIDSRLKEGRYYANAEMNFLCLVEMS
jgi:hypothetical protein